MASGMILLYDVAPTLVEVAMGISPVTSVISDVLR